MLPVFFWAFSWIMAKESGFRKRNAPRNAVRQTVEKPSAGKNASIFGQRASQSFPARRRENKVRIIKIPGHVPGILNYNRASVRQRRARSPMQILLRSKPALIESVSKRLFRHAEWLSHGVRQPFCRAKRRIKGW